MKDKRWVQRLSAALDTSGTRLLERASAEREIAVNRLIFGCLTLFYQSALWANGLWDPAFLAINLGCVIAGVALLLHIQRRSKRSPFRRYLSLCLDIGVQSGAQFHFTPYTLVLFPLYVWTILGYGFRYGIPYLRVASVLSLAGFAVVVAANPDLQSQPFVVAALGGCLIAIPPYLEALLRRVIAATEAARASNEARAFVLLSLSHKMRTPLGAMVGAAEQLDSTALDPDQRAMLSALRQESRSILSEMDALLEIARTETGHTPVATGEFSLLALLQEIIALARVEARTKGLDLSLHVTAGTSLYVQTDRRHLGRIVQTLLENAIKFTTIGSVLVSVDGSRTKDASPLLRVEVIDTGIGVPRHLQAEIWDAYASANEAVLSQHSSAGLGLNIAKHLVHLLGGRIGLESRAGNGSVFWIELPVLVARGSSQTDLAGLGVVLLSQEPARLEGIRGRLERLGARASVVDRADRIGPVIAGSADDCNRVSLVMDGQDVDPVEMALAIRRQSLFTRVPLILLAATPAVASLAVRRHYMTTISPSSSDEDLCTALRIVGPHDAETRSEPSMEADPIGPSRPQTRPLRVLVADDSRTSQVTLAQVLTHAGHKVRAVACGDAALDALEREEFDVAIMDLQGPSTTDTASLYRVIELGRPRVPIIGLAADATMAKVQGGTAVGFDACLEKPVNHDLLLQAVAEVVPEKHKCARVVIATTQAPNLGVAKISSHPRFTAGLGPPSADEFEHLSAIGANGLRQIAEAFQADTRTALAYLSVALAKQDLQAFKGQLTALRSAAVAIDAARLSALCDAGTALPENKLRLEGKAILDHLTREVERVREVLGA